MSSGLSGLKGVLALIWFISNTVLWCGLLYLVAIVRFMTWGSTREALGRLMVRLAECWISGNSFEINTLGAIKWNIHLPTDLRMDCSYLAIANHQSWVDIVAIQHALNRRVPFLRFFLKNELRYVPLLGIAWKALDFPFMKRYTREYLAKHPEKRGTDLIETKRACDKLRGKPVSILNFLEGTRFTASKHASAAAGFTHLLPPKTGGIAFVIEAMGDQFDSILDITVHYPGGARSIWDMFCGRIREITVWVDRIEIPRAMVGGNYFEDETFRASMQAWIQEIWAAKDKRLASYH